MDGADIAPIGTHADRPTLDGWPVRSRESADLGYRLLLHVAWVGPEASAAGPALVHAYRGRSPAEWATVSVIADADPATELDTWVEAPMAVTGFPLVPPFPAPATRLLDWAPPARSPALAARLAVADARCFSGLATTTIDGARALMRLYVLLARDERCAWNIALAFETACPPGSDDELVCANDHVRAAATFGDLRLGSVQPKS